MLCASFSHSVCIINIWTNRSLPLSAQPYFPTDLMSIMWLPSTTGGRWQIDHLMEAERQRKLSHLIWFSSLEHKPIDPVSTQCRCRVYKYWPFISCVELMKHWVYLQHYEEKPFLAVNESHPAKHRHTRTKAMKYKLDFLLFVFFRIMLKVLMYSHPLSYCHFSLFPVFGLLE